MNQLLKKTRQGVCNRSALIQLSRRDANGCQRLGACVLFQRGSTAAFTHAQRIGSRAIDSAISLEKESSLCLTDRFDISRQNACANNQD